MRGKLSNETEDEDNEQSRSVAPPKAKRIKISMTPEDLKDACVEMTTVNGRPFTAVEDSGFRKIIDPIINGFNTAVAVNAQNVRSDVIEAADKTKKLIIEELKNKIISIKIDCCTRLDRSILGINAQFHRKGKITLRTLAQTEILLRHTGENIMEMVLMTLEDYEIPLGHIYSITTDNGANILRAVRLMATEQENRNKEAEDGVNEQDDMVNYMNTFIK